MKPRHIVITGVSKGLGEAMARSFDALGYVVSGCARSEDALATLASELSDRAMLSPVDVSNEAVVAAWAQDVIAANGAPDLLINSAAIINRSAPLWEISAEEFSDLIDINIKGATHVIRHFLPAMIEGSSGVVVNFSSGWGRSTSPEVAPYCASKWAVEGLTQALAQELQPGLAAVAFNPGIIDTAMLRSCFGNGASDYPDATLWAKRAVPFLDQLGSANNGQSLSCP